MLVSGLVVFSKSPKRKVVQSAFFVLNCGDFWYSLHCFCAIDNWWWKLPWKMNDRWLRAGPFWIEKPDFWWLRLLITVYASWWGLTWQRHALNLAGKPESNQTSWNWDDVLYTDTNKVDKVDCVGQSSSLWGPGFFLESIIQASHAEGITFETGAVIGGSAGTSHPALVYFPVKRSSYAVSGSGYLN